jgi:hypothetical protein
MPTWNLEDVVAAARMNPETFFIPSFEERCAVEIGRLARLHFVLSSPGPDDPRAERMWVEVENRQGVGASTRYRGALTNEPVYIRDLRAGDKVEFGPDHIARLLLPCDHPDALEVGEKSALVSAKVLEPGAVARFAYREAPDRDEDSGWRLFVGGESDEYANDVRHIRICNVYWLADRDPSLRQILNAPEGHAFERPNESTSWTRVLDWEAEQE